MERSPHITVHDLAVRYGDYEVMHDVSFTVCRGDVFVIMGGSGSGKSTLLNTMIGLVEPATGEVLYDRKSFTRATPHERQVTSARKASERLSSQLDTTLHDVGGAARSLRRLADQLGRDPGSLLRGGKP
jgi:ABC-type transporter Mla maintaining outer membrane lipid asymmetry ATPase subunit MlaF